MPEDLRAMMDGASDGPVPTLDPDELWRVGTRRRRARQAAMLAPLAMLVLLVGGLAVMAGDNAGTDGDGTGDDSVDGAMFADLSPVDASTVDAYLAALDAAGGRDYFADDRAAVEYAWRVECFPGLVPTELAELGEATAVLVTALDRELVRSAAVMVDGDTGSDELERARGDTDAAITAYLAWFPDVLSQIAPEEVDAATNRLGDLEVVRAAVDQRQLDVQNTIALYDHTAGALTDALRSATVGQGDSDWFNHSRLLDAGTAAAVTGAWVVAVPYTMVPQASLVDSVEEEDRLRSEWTDTADPADVSETSDWLSTDEQSAFDAYLESILRSLQSGSIDDITEASGPTGELSVAEVIDATYARIDLGRALASFLAFDQTLDIWDVDRDGAVDAACTATDDAILTVDPSGVGQPANVTTTTVSVEAGPATTEGPPATTAPPVTAPSTTSVVTGPSTVPEDEPSVTTSVSVPPSGPLAGDDSEGPTTSTPATAPPSAIDPTATTSPPQPRP